jgi:hypothetical protein
MPNEPIRGAVRRYRMGDVDAGARVAQGENISWVEGIAGLPDGPALASQFAALLERPGRKARLLRGTSAGRGDSTA